MDREAALLCLRCSSEVEEMDREAALLCLRCCSSGGGEGRTEQLESRSSGETSLESQASAELAVQIEQRPLSKLTGRGVTWTCDNTSLAGSYFANHEVSHWWAVTCFQTSHLSFCKIVSKQYPQQSLNALMCSSQHTDPMQSKGGRMGP
eukprot:1137481-Pelagomonas_calceolata.AAC.2